MDHCFALALDCKTKKMGECTTPESECIVDTSGLTCVEPGPRGTSAGPVVEIYDAENHVCGKSECKWRDTTAVNDALCSDTGPNLLENEASSAHLDWMESPEKVFKM